MSYHLRQDNIPVCARHVLKPGEHCCASWRWTLTRQLTRMERRGVRHVTIYQGLCPTMTDTTEPERSLAC